VGYSDHLAQVLCIKTKKLPNGPITTYNRHFTENNIAEIKYLLHKEIWDEVLEREEPNTAVNLFSSTFSYYFNIAFPLKVTRLESTNTNRWITKGLITSRNKLRLMCNTKRTTNLPVELLKHIKS
jgi:tyrosyl-tRNA synthetase